MSSAPPSRFRAAATLAPRWSAVKGHARALVRVAAAVLTLVGPAAASVIEVGRFEAPATPGSLPEGWRPLTFKKVARHTEYRLVPEGDRWVLRAESRAAASGLFRPVEVEPRQYPVLTWRWKVDGVLASADARRKEGDDYPARLYVAFRYEPATASLLDRARFAAYRALYGEYPPRGALNYIWDNRLPPGTVLDNAYTNRAKMIVLRSGPALAGRWVEESRNIVEDYRRAFGEEPPALAGIAVMTDTDNTGESAVAYYDAITLRGASD